MNAKVLSFVLAVVCVSNGQEMSGNQLSETIPAVVKKTVDESVGVHNIPNIRSDNGSPILVIESVANRPSSPVVLNPVQTLVLSKPVQSGQNTEKIVEVAVRPPQVVVQQETIKEPVVQNTVPVVVSTHRPCQVFRGKGECLTIPNFFSCIRDGGVLAPDYDDCAFTQACCIRNFFSQFTTK